MRKINNSPCRRRPPSPRKNIVIGHGRLTECCESAGGNAAAATYIVIDPKYRAQQWRQKLMLLLEEVAIRLGYHYPFFPTQPCPLFLPLSFLPFLLICLILSPIFRIAYNKQQRCLSFNYIACFLWLDVTFCLLFSSPRHKKLSFLVYWFNIQFPLADMFPDSCFL